MRFSYAESMIDPSFYAPLARAAEEAGYHSMVIPDSICYPLHADSVYPYSPDGSREFLEGKPFVEPFSLIPFLGAVTSRIRFTTFVVKMPIRNPVLLAKQATSTAVLTGNRLVLGVGTSPWREDYDVLGVDWASRGRRMDESIAILRGLAAGGYFEHHGRCFDLPPVQIAPVPSEPIPVLIGGHSDAALRRAARLGDGWMHGGGDPADLPRLLARLTDFRREAGGGRGAAVRGTRDLGRRLHRRRRPTARGAGGDRRDHRIPLALHGRSRRRAAGAEDRQPPPVRRRRDRENVDRRLPLAAQSRTCYSFSNRARRCSAMMRLAIAVVIGLVLAVVAVVIVVNVLSAS